MMRPGVARCCKTHGWFDEPYRSEDMVQAVDSILKPKR
jgi:hypothetical protein